MLATLSVVTLLTLPQLGLQLQSTACDNGPDCLTEIAGTSTFLFEVEKLFLHQMKIEDSTGNLGKPHLFSGDC